MRPISAADRRRVESQVELRRGILTAAAIDHPIGGPVLRLQSVHTAAAFEPVDPALAYELVDSGATVKLVVSVSLREGKTRMTPQAASA